MSKRKNDDHTLLVQLRMQCNWTQEELAAKIGASVISVSRWERGLAVPSLHYRKKLQTLFQTDDVLFSPPAKKVLFSPSMPDIFDPAIPHLPASALIGRDETIDALVSSICIGTGSLAIRGLPGVGKTALLIQLAHHPQIKQEFCDGILWVGLGPRPHLIESLNRWGTLLGASSSDTNTLVTVHDWAQCIHSRIGERRMLIFVDDAWQLSEAQSFHVGGGRCMHVLSTRFPPLAAAFAPNAVEHIAELEPDESRILLHKLAPSLGEEVWPETEQLLRFIGGLPLAVTLLGRYLQLQVHSGQMRRLHKALDVLNRSIEKRLGVSTALVPWEDGTNWPIATEVSLSVAIELTVTLLPHEAQEALYALSVLPAKPAFFSEHAALAVCKIQEDILDLLVDYGLLEHEVYEEATTHERYYLHQTIADYARLHRTDPTVEERLVHYALGVITNVQSNSKVLQYELPTLMLACETGLRSGLYDESLKGCVHLIPYLIQMRLYSMADVLFMEALPVAEKLGDEKSATQLWLLKGEMAEQACFLREAEQHFLKGLAIVRKTGTNQELQGKLFVKVGSVLSDQGFYERAQPYLLEGLASIKESNEWSYICTVYRQLGETADSLGYLEQARQWYLDGLAIARQAQAWSFASPILQDLGVAESRRGAYQEAERYYSEALEYAQRTHDVVRESAILMNLGMLAYLQADYEHAVNLSLQSLALARSLEHRLRLASVLQNLGLFECILGNFTQAEQYLAEGLFHAHAMGHQWLIYETEGVWGQLLLAQGKVVEAEKKYQYMLDGALEMKAPLLQALAFYGLAQVEVHPQRNNKTRALDYARQSLALLEQLQESQAQEVQQFIQQLEA